MPFFVYILCSDTTGRYYIGHTDNIQRRLSQHNDPNYQGSLHTKRHKGPWKCVYSEAFDTRSEAMQREGLIKSKKSRVFIEGLFSRQSLDCLRD